MVLIRVIITSIVLAILGVAFLLINPHDDAMLNFGWFLVVLGSILAAIFTFMWVKKQMLDADEEEEEEKPSKRRKGSKGPK